MTLGEVGDLVRAKNWIRQQEQPAPAMSRSQAVAELWKRVEAKRRN